jgi:dienelactone hydrolase
VRRRSGIRLSVPLVVGIFAVGAGVGALIIALSHHAAPKRVVVAAAGVTTSTTTTITTNTTTQSRAPRPAPPVRVTRRLSVGVNIRIMRFVDTSRYIQTPSGRVPRAVTTIVRYPVVHSSGGGGASGSVDGTFGPPYPLIVFGHGFAVTPHPYARLLNAWTKAGYVVAAPIFPLENANAPGGPDEQDLVNQPEDMSLVITRLAAADRSGPLAGMIDIRHVAVAGQSDGGDTALATAYDPSVRDRRVGAAIILSGAEDPFAAQFSFSPHGPPLLATQGTADTINPPDATYSFFADASAPKYLLKLIGASHLPPYTVPGSQLATVQRVTIAFLNYYFKHKRAALRRYISAGTAGPNSDFIADP